MTLHCSSEEQGKLCLNNFEKQNLIINQLLIEFKAIFDLGAFRIGSDEMISPKHLEGKLLPIKFFSR